MTRKSRNVQQHSYQDIKARTGEPSARAFSSIQRGAPSLPPLLIVLLHTVLPVGTHGPTSTESAHRLAHGLIDDRGPLVVSMVVGGPVLGDAMAGSLPGCVDVGPQEQELPAVLLLLLLDHLADAPIGILPAGVLHAIRGDDKMAAPPGGMSPIFCRASRS